MKTAILINSYNREPMLRRLVSQILSQIEATINVYLDGCEYGEIEGVKVFHEPHHGRERYYELCQKGFRGMPKADYYYKIDDDMQIVDGFFEKSIEYWESIEDANKVGLNLLKDQRDSMWGSHKRSKTNENVDYSDWIDLNWMMDKYSFQLLQRLTFERPSDLSMSSGVGRQVCRHMRKFGNLYQVRETLLIHGDHESEMNPQRKTTGEILTSI